MITYFNEKLYVEGPAMEVPKNIIIIDKLRYGRWD